MIFVIKRYLMIFKICLLILIVFIFIGRLRNYDGDVEDNVD